MGERIPDDVMATARGIAMDWAVPETEEQCMEDIARAIMAERNRCIRCLADRVGSYRALEAAERDIRSGQ